MHSEAWSQLIDSFLQFGEPTMLNGLNASASALGALEKLQEATASNLAHLNTPGHRRLVSGFSELLDPVHGQAFFGSTLDRQSADFSDGRLERTDRSLDLALKGDGFFVYRGANGEMYSRNGVLHRDAATNELSNGDGFRILDENRRPIVYTGELSTLAIGSDGSIHDGNQSVGKLAIASFDDNRLLESENQTYFRQGTATVRDSEDVNLLQGSRELSNASAVTEMISLIICTRHFEATQRTLRTISDTLQANTKS